MTLDDEQFNELVEAGRVSHELSARHGRNAFSYAEKLRIQAEADGRSDEVRFWAKVAAALKPRQRQTCLGSIFE